MSRSLSGKNARVKGMIIKMSFLLEVKDMNKKFGEHTVLEHVSFTIEQGEVVGLVGRNGMGKTTLMKCILGLMKVDTGEIRFEGKIDYALDKNQMDKIGYLLDCKLFENLNAYENVKIQEWYKGRHYGREEEKQVIETALNLVDLKNDKKKVKEYSFGMKQRLGLALALLGDTKLLILDEPFVGLDPVGINTIREFIRSISKEKHISVLISSHQLSEIEDICERYLFIGDKKITSYKNNDQKRMKIFTNQVLTKEVLSKIPECESQLDDKCISFLFDQKTLNIVIKYLVEHHIEIKDIEIQKGKLDKLFIEEKK